MRKLILGLAAPLALLAGTAAMAKAPTAKPSAAKTSDYGHDLISVATPGRQAPIAQTADCTVWANAEGLGVGPAQLGGMHGLTMHINLAPMAGDTATSFEAGMASLKASSPGAPAWLIAAIEKNRAAIETACKGDHPDPVKIYGLTAKDRR